MYYNNSKSMIHTQSSQNKSNTQNRMNFVRFSRTSNAMKQPSQEVNNVVKNKSSPESKMTWGEPTWFLLHTLAQKISAEGFSQIRTELFQLIIRICSNLPCPECAEHATKYLESIHFHAITTKDDLKILLWNFHNTVNERKGYPLFSFENLSKYNHANTGNIVRNFMHHFEKKGFNMRLAAHSFHRGLAITYIRKWFANYGHFLFQ